jgi:hypothetical protein
MKQSPESSFLGHSRLIPLAGMISLVLLPACSSETRDNIWRTLDPVGHKHSQSPFFNPRKHKDTAPASSETSPEKEWDLTRQD